MTNKSEKHNNQSDNVKKIRVLFVCLGNICRSPAAQGVFEALVEREGKHYLFEIDSAGTGNYHTGELPDRRMRVHARQRGYDLTHRARQFRTLDFDDFDVIVAMDDSNYRHLQLMARTSDDEKKIVKMGDYIGNSYRYDYVPDPYYEGSEGFELVLDLLEDATYNLYKKLVEK